MEIRREANTKRALREKEYREQWKTLGEFRVVSQQLSVSFHCIFCAYFSVLGCISLSSRSPITHLLARMHLFHLPLLNKNLVECRSATGGKE
mmetsp:Transcript_28635/g.73105  ORF Transcript_28635/g.73105 Transcript_28635/m.73105 type:complete len:92 (-) Transcript_28635:157-432(-)